MKIVKDKVSKEVEAVDPAANSNAPSAPVTALDALRSLWPAIVAQVEDEMKASRFASLAEMKAALEAMDKIQMGAKMLLGMIEAHKQAAPIQPAPAPAVEAPAKG